MQTKNLIKNITVSLFLTGIIVSNTITGLAVSDTEFGSIPTESPNFGIDMTVCFAVFDWERFIENRQAGRETNPYIDKDCLRQNNLVIDEEVQVRYYRDFETGSESTRTAIGDIPVLGIFPNQGFEAQGIVNREVQDISDGFDNVDRSKLSSLDNIFTQEDLNGIFSTTNGEYSTGMPRIFSTGPDEFRTNDDGSEVYVGGWCRAENGRIIVRDRQVDRPLTDSYFTSLGVDKTDAMTTCALPEEETVKQRNLQVYQFVWEISYPNAGQCRDWFGLSEADCKNFYRTYLGKELAGNTDLESGEKFVYAYTFYGSFDDQYTRWVRWATPDVGNRANSDNPNIRNFNGYIAFEM